MYFYLLIVFKVIYRCIQKAYILIFTLYAVEIGILCDLAP